MRILTLLISVIIVFSGCSNNYLSNSKTTHLAPSLRGLSQKNIYSRFGEPTKKQILVDFDRRREVWHYHHKHKPSLRVVFSDGYASKVSYR